MEGLTTLKHKTVEHLRDALVNRGYSRDFAYVRSEYLRQRTMLVCALFRVPYVVTAT